jgi:Protein of unknown function (DUF3224)
MTMKKTATGKIEVKTYEPVPYEEPTDGPKLNELHVTETFTGDVQGEGRARMLQAQRDDGSASFCAIERVSGTLDGRTGTFLLQDEGGLQGTKVKGTWVVIPGSGTGALTGLRGDGTFEAELGQHASYVLQYWFE